MKKPIRLKKWEAGIILMCILLLVLPLFLSYVPFLFLLRLPRRPSGVIQQISPSGEIKEWKVNDSSGMGLNFKLTSGTMERQFSIYPGQQGIIRVKDAKFVTDIGINNTSLDCLPFKGSMWVILQGRFLMKHRFHPYYFGKISIQCTDPFQPGVLIKGDISFDRIRSW